MRNVALAAILVASPVAAQRTVTEPHVNTVLSGKAGDTWNGWVSDGSGVLSDTRGWVVYHRGLHRYFVAATIVVLTGPHGGWVSQRITNLVTLNLTPQQRAVVVDCGPTLAVFEGHHMRGYSVRADGSITFTQKTGSQESLCDVGEN